MACEVRLGKDDPADHQTHKTTCVVSTNWVELDPTLDGMAALIRSMGEEYNEQDHTMIGSINSSKKPHNAKLGSTRNANREFMIKVQAPMSSDGGQQHPPNGLLRIYDEKRRVEVLAGPDNFTRGHEDYLRLIGFVNAEGCSGGLKIYANAYQTEDGMLRVMMDEACEPPLW